MTHGRRVLLVVALCLLQPALAAAQSPAASALAQAEALRNQGTKAALTASIDPYEAALRAARNAGDAATEAAALTGLGRTRDALGDKRAAIQLFAQALPIQQAAGDHSAVSYTLNFLALAYDFLGERPKSVDLLDQALVEARAARDRRVEGITLGNEGLLQQNLGDRRKALDYYAQALAVHREVGNVRGQATTLTNIGTTYDALGDKPKAIEYLEEALPLRRQIGDPREEAATLNNLALVYFTTDQPQAALDRYQQALTKWREAGDRSGEGATLHNIASVEESRAEYQAAIDHYTQALAIFRATGFKPGEGNSLNNMGALYSRLGDHARAIECYTQALALHRAVGNRSSEASTLSNLAAEEFFRGDRDAAFASLNAALPLWQATGDISGEARSLIARARLDNAAGRFDQAADAATRGRDLAQRAHSRRVEALAVATLADTMERRGRPDEAAGLFRTALAAQQEIADRTGAAATMLGLAQAERAQGDLEGAQQHATAAVDLIETFRIAVASPDLRMSYFASVQDYFDTAVGVLMDLQARHPDTDRWATAAFEMSERARARGFMDLLAESRIDVRAGVDRTLLAREREINAALSARAERQTRLLSTTHTDAQAAGIDGDIRTLLSEREQVAARIRETSPRYAALSSTAPVSADTIRRDLLDTDTTLVEIALGADRSYAFVVSRAGVRGIPLPRAADLDAAAAAFVKAARAATGDATPAAARLARLLLQPLDGQLTARRLVFIASGNLQYVPVGALPEPRSGRVLLLDHEVVALPSAAVLQVLRAGTTRRPHGPRNLLVLADPVFTADDPRVTPAASRQRASAATGAQEALSRSLELLGEDGRNATLGRLIGSRREANAIASLLPPAAVTRALDFSASREVLQQPLDRYALLHFATHALLNSEHPELSGIVLSLVDAHGTPREGYVGMAEIVNLKLSADLVVLSACQTALGPNVRGEGLLALSRAFMYAGAPRVVATTWKVDDTATAALMQRFYEGMLGPSRLSASAALRAAQIYVRRQPRWRAPYYWAPFVLQGDWR